MATNSGLKRQLEDIFKRFEGYFPTVISPDLHRIGHLLTQMNDPQNRLPPVLHVAGTNGKGSTCAFLRSMCEAAGLRVHVYTSPHLIRFNERIRLAGKPITDAYLYDCLRRTEAALAGAQITFFEAMTAAAFLAFSEVEADVLILEVGLGGRLDATNIIAASDMSIITPVGMDHQQFLGNGLSDIAREKSGIIRPNGHVVTYQTHNTAKDIIVEEAQKKLSQIRVLDEGDMHWVPDELPLAGAHQRLNAALAGLALQEWRPDIFSDAIIRRGVLKAQWPARLQKLNGSRYFSGIGGDIWLDGGHNPHAAGAIARFFSDRPGPITLICAMQDNKDAEGYFAALTDLAPQVITIPNYGGRPYFPEAALAQAAVQAGIDAKAKPCLEDALADAWTQGAATVLICGSLYLAGEVLRAIEENG